MDAKIFRINYKSDFILTLVSDAGWAVPFCIKFWTGVPSQAYYVQWDGTTYTHCAPVAGEPTKLQVQFDDHHLPIGNLKYQVAYHFTVADFPNDTEDEVLNQANITTEIDGEEYQVMLDFNGETAPEIQFSLPAYANEAQRIANEEQREREFSQMETDFETMQQESESATSGAESVNAELNGNILTVTDRNGVSKSVNTKGDKGDPGTTDYNDLENKPDLSIFITKTVNDLVNYYTKSETYTKAEADAAITQLLNYVSHSYTNTTDLNTLLAQKQDTLVSGTNIKTINNNSILGSGNISIQGGSDNIYKAAVTVSALTSSPLPSGTVDALIAMRSELQGYDLVLLPDSDSVDATCTPAVVIENGSTFQMVFYDGNALYTVYGDTNDSYTVTKTEFYTANDLEPTANAEALNNIMLMFDLPKSQSEFYNTDNNKHYFYVLPPASENITTAEEFVTWLVGGATKHLMVTHTIGVDEPATFAYVSGQTYFDVEIWPDNMFNVMCTKAENGYYKCEISMNGSGGPDWTSITLV